MPTFVPHVAIDLHKLLEYGSVTAGALGSEACGVMIMAVYVTIVLIIGILRAE